MKIVGVVAAVAVAIAVAVVVPGSATATGKGSGCSSLDVQVPGSVVEKQIVPAPGAGTAAALLSGSTEPGFTIHGKLCLPEGGAPKTVMLAMHGILYTNGYWNVEYKPDTYNFSQYMNEAGYAVFAIDRLGYGGSSKPPAALVTLDAQAEVVHEIIGKLRRGEIGGHRFHRVMLVGYSYGTATSWRETSKYNDADAILTTAWGSTFQNIPLLRVFTSFRPAQLDPRFRDRPVGYLYSPEGRNQNYFYDLSNVDPEIIKYSNEVLHDTITAGEIASFYPRYGGIPLANAPSGKEITLPLSNQTKSIKVPTFLVNGTGELFFCGIDQQHCTSSQELQKQESKYFSEAACFRAAVIPNAGHNLNLQRNAPFAYETMRTFADQVLGPDGDNLDDYKRTCTAFSGPNVATGRARFGALK